MNDLVVRSDHGHCCTGALEVALAADFLVAADSETEALATRIAAIPTSQG